ncbi:hypothetical protein [Aerolutibacter daejeonensis]|uniref:hypothetical protein n=1 Tax=Aerolutibacter daejeonensis TaxID=346181 RepID=UPI0012EBDEB9|nr:hypothetical protein [Lysobacter daejeonensis]
MPLLSILLPACSLERAKPDVGAIATTAVREARYSGAPNDPLQATCQRWTLTPAQVERFFAISQRYSDSPYGSFYQLPCDISGTILVEQRTWEFQINGGGTATWVRGNEVRHWGCSAKECEPLVLLLTDGMSGE